MGAGRLHTDFLPETGMAMKKVLVERSELLIKEGMEIEFAAVMDERGLPLLAGLPGVNSVKLGRGVENPSKFMLLIEWEAMDAHVAFTKNPAYGEFRQMLGPFSKGGAMEHFEMS
jgi:heme-degrading monooxygenase HmoA